MNKEAFANIAAIAIFVGLVIAGLAYWQYHGTDSNQVSNANVTSAQNSAQHEVVINLFGCRSRKFLDRYDRIDASGDGAAADKLLAQGLQSGQCTEFHKGERVYVQDRVVHQGLVKIRRSGEVAAYWTENQTINH